MTDLVFVIAAYAAVFGGLALYVVTLARRTTAARTQAATLERERQRDPASGRMDGETPISDDGGERAR